MKGRLTSDSYDESFHYISSPEAVADFDAVLLGCSHILCPYDTSELFPGGQGDTIHHRYGEDGLLWREPDNRAKDDRVRNWRSGPCSRYLEGLYGEPYTIDKNVFQSTKSERPTELLNCGMPHKLARI